MAHKLGRETKPKYTEFSQIEATQTNVSFSNPIIGISANSRPHLFPGRLFLSVILIGLKIEKS